MNADTDFVYALDDRHAREALSLTREDLKSHAEYITKVPWTVIGRRVGFAFSLSSLSEFGPHVVDPLTASSELGAFFKDSSHVVV